MKNNVKKRNLLLMGAVATVLTLDQLEAVEQALNMVTKVYALSDDESNAEDINKVSEEELNNLMRQYIKSDNYDSYQIRDEVVADLANKFSELYGISKTDCLEIIDDNIDYIVESDDIVGTLNKIIQVNIDNGYCQVSNKKNNLFETGTGNINYVNNFKTTKRGQTYKKYADMYGIDYNLALALAKQESNLDHEGHLPGGNSFNGFAYGISQIENTLFGSRVKVFNFEKGKYETIEIVKDYPSKKEEGIVYLSVMNYSDNVRIGVAKLQEKVRSYDYNLAMALQAYNYGSGALNVALKVAAKENNLSKEEIICDKTNFCWLKHVKKLHNNPNNYGIKWDYGTYGDKNYINNVMQYVSEEILRFKTPNNEVLLINIKDQTTITIRDKDLEKLCSAITTIENSRYNQKTFTKVRTKK